MDINKLHEYFKIVVNDNNTLFNAVDELARRQNTLPRDKINCDKNSKKSKKVNQPDEEFTP